MFSELNAKHENKKPENFTSYKDKIVFFFSKKGHKNYNLKRLWVKIELCLSGFAKREETKDLNAKMKI